MIDQPEYEWLMIDASYVKVHAQGAGAIGGNQKTSLTKGGSTRRYNALMKIKRWRGIATRYAKRADLFEAAVQIRCLAMWCKVL